MNLRPFQIIILGFFLALAVGGLIFFAVFRGFGSDPNPYGTSVEIWGTFDQNVFNRVFQSVRADDENFKAVTYVQKDSRTFRSELVNAIAEGRGPDVVVLPSNLLISERAKIYPIPYETLSARTIRDTYADGAEIFSLSDGIYSIPFAVDPLVMYWNRDLFATAGLASAPTTWEAVVGSTVPALVKFAEAPIFSIRQAALGFGEYSNITNASHILVMLMMQAGSQLITEGERGYSVGLNDVIQGGRPPMEAALDFYTQFANPARPNYTWNRSLQNDRSMFLSGELAVYFGFGSEYESLRRGNANLNFDAAPIPQGSGVTVKKGYGVFYGFSILRSSDNIEGAYRAAEMLGRETYANFLAGTLELAPVHRTLLAEAAPNPVRQTLYLSALTARGFLSPDPAAFETVMRTFIEDVTSGRRVGASAVSDALQRIRQLLP